MASTRILVVDDNPVELGRTKEQLEASGHLVETAVSGEEALKKITFAPFQFSVAVVDFRLGGMNGAETIAKLYKVSPKTKVLIFSADETRLSMKLSFRSGALDFIDKAEGYERLKKEVTKWVKIFEEEHLTLPESYESPNVDLIASIGMIGRSDALAGTAVKIKKYKRRAAPVLIVGLQGTGKELIAKALHEGPDPFLAVNCATFNGNPDLMKKTLFGVKKGAYTGASQDEPGVLRRAGKGTVFLDEIHRLGLLQQQILLRTLQEKTVRPVGSEVCHPIECRIISGAQPEIMASISHGQFQRDLYDRINVGRIETEPLCNRTEDIEPLIAHFLKSYEAATGDSKRILMKTVRMMEKYNWPGNVRELENEIHRLCIEVDGDVIRPDHLDAKFFTAKSSNYEPYRQRRNRKQIIESLLYEQGLSERAAARKLGMAYSTFQRRMKEFGITSPRSRSQGKA